MKILMIEQLLFSLQSWLADLSRVLLVMRFL